MTAGVLWVAALWAIFAATHMALASRTLRPRLAGALGERGFLGVYSLIALAVFVPLVWMYVAHRHEGALLWTPVVDPIARWTLYVGQGVAWTLVVASFASPSPVTVGLPEERRPREPRGVHRITRHPLFMGLGLAGLLHLPFNAFASDVAFWAGFPLFALLGCAHQDARKRAMQPGYADWVAKTPFLPFAGRSSFSGVREMSPAILAAGIALTVGLRWLHGPLFR